MLNSKEKEMVSNLPKLTAKASLQPAVGCYVTTHSFANRQLAGLTPAMNKEYEEIFKKMIKMPQKFIKGFGAGFKKKWHPVYVQIGSSNSYNVILSLMMCPLITDRPPIPDQLGEMIVDNAPYISGFSKGSIAGSALQRTIIQGLGLPSFVGLFPFLFVVNDAAVGLDIAVQKNPRLGPTLESFNNEVAQKVAEQYKRVQEDSMIEGFNN